MTADERSDLAVAAGVAAGALTRLAALMRLHLPLGTGVMGRYGERYAVACHSPETGHVGLACLDRPGGWHRFVPVRELLSWLDPEYAEEPDRG